MKRASDYHMLSITFVDDFPCTPRISVCLPGVSSMYSIVLKYVQPPGAPPLVNVSGSGKPRSTDLEYSAWCGMSIVMCVVTILQSAMCISEASMHVLLLEVLVSGMSTATPYFPGYKSTPNLSTPISRLLPVYYNTPPSYFSMTTARSSVDIFTLRQYSAGHVTEIAARTPFELSLPVVRRSRL